MTLALYVFCSLFCALWVGALTYTWWSLARLPVLRGEATDLSPGCAEWPLVSVIVPACNEAAHLDAALESLLAQDYSRLELIVVDDRSTDATGLIIDRRAAADRRVRALHVRSLPDGWLGKVHALHQGVSQARGDWYLFTDADVRFRAGALRRAVRYATRRRIDHLAGFPEIEVGSSFWLGVAVRAFLLLLCVSVRVAEVNRDGGRPMGVGAFNLVTAAAFARTPGFEWLRMEAADDLGLGLMLSQAGARTRLVNAEGEISVPWYGSVAAMFTGLEKNSFGPGAQYSYPRQLLMVLMLWCLASTPLAAAVAGYLLGDPVLLGAGGGAVAASLVFAGTMPRKSLRDIAGYLLLPLGVVLVSLIMLRSAYRCLRNGGIDWRGTHYPVDALRHGQRVRF